jgi:hypothetical protein
MHYGPESEICYALPYRLECRICSRSMGPLQELSNTVQNNKNLCTVKSLSIPLTLSWAAGVIYDSLMSHRYNTKWTEVTMFYKLNLSSQNV